jgi:hypothetical protein
MATGRSGGLSRACSARQDRAYAGSMNTIHLTDAELEMARHGMTAYLRSFGHDESDTIVLIKAVLARLAAAQPVPDPPATVG